MVSPGSVLADIGTDHGYVPIYLLEQKKIPEAIAMDVRSGPLARAKEHIAAYGMGDYIQTRLSDGVEALSPGEADSILIAGMGGGLVMHILENGASVCHQARELVLQPQSELARVRAYLDIRGYVTEAENMVKEDGKYYPMFRVHYGGKEKEPLCLSEDFSELDTWIDRAGEAQKLELYYGKQLLSEKHPVLQEYLRLEMRIYENIWNSLKGQPDSEHIRRRREEVRLQMSYNNRAMQQMGMEKEYEGKNDYTGNW